MKKKDLCKQLKVVPAHPSPAPWGRRLRHVNGIQNLWSKCENHNDQLNNCFHQKKNINMLIQEKGSML